MADDDDALALVARDAGLDGVDRALAKVEAALRVWVDVPGALVEHALSGGQEQLAADELDGGLVRGHVAEDLDFAKVVENLDLEALVVPGDRFGGLHGALEWAGEDGVDLLEGERLARQSCLHPAVLGERRIDDVADDALEVDVGLGVPDHDHLRDALNVGEEGLVEHAGYALLPAVFCH